MAAAGDRLPSKLIFRLHLWYHQWGALPLIFSPCLLRWGALTLFFKRPKSAMNCNFKNSESAGLKKGRNLTNQKAHLSGFGVTRDLFSELHPPSVHLAHGCRVKGESTPGAQHRASRWRPQAHHQVPEMTQPHVMEAAFLQWLHPFFGSHQACRRLKPHVYPM